MTSSKVQPVDTLKAWSSIPRLLRNSVAGLSARQLDGRHGSENWSIREYVHHLIEANIIASTIVIAALGKPGSVYDWSWVQPEGEWAMRLGYNRVALEPGLALLEHLCRYITLVVRKSPRGLPSQVQLKDTEGQELWTRGPWSRSYERSGSMHSTTCMTLRRLGLFALCRIDRSGELVPNRAPQLRRLKSDGTAKTP